MSLTGHGDVAFFNDVANDAESTQKSIITSIIANLKSEITCELINRIPGKRLLISSLPDLALRTHVDRSESIAIQQAFSKLCLVNLISKDTHLVFSLTQHCIVNFLFKLCYTIGLTYIYSK